MKEIRTASIHTTPVEVSESDERNAPWVRSLLAAVRSTRYGSVEVVIHDGRVVQLEQRAKVRFADDRRPDHRGRDQESHDRADRTSGSFD